MLFHELDLYGLQARYGSVCEKNQVSDSWPFIFSSYSLTQNITLKLFSEQSEQSNQSPYYARMVDKKQQCFISVPLVMTYPLSFLAAILKIMAGLVEKSIWAL